MSDNYLANYRGNCTKKILLVLVVLVTCCPCACKEAAVKAISPSSLYVVPVYPQHDMYPSLGGHIILYCAIVGLSGEAFSDDTFTHLEPLIKSGCVTCMFVVFNNEQIDCFIGLWHFSTCLAGNDKRLLSLTGL